MWSCGFVLEELGLQGLSPQGGGEKGGPWGQALANSSRAPAAQGVVYLCSSVLSLGFLVCK